MHSMLLQTNKAKVITAMIVKGIISSINLHSNTAEVSLPEYDNTTTGELPLYNRNAHGLEIGEFVVVALFNGTNDLCNGVIL